jgi:hypothetical protein
MKANSLGLLLGILIPLAACSSPESPGSKAEYAVLQGAEFTYRDQPISGPEIRTVQGYELLSLPATRLQSLPVKSGRTWIMLKAEHDPYWKQIPQTDAFSVPKSLLDKLISDGRVSPAVERALRSHASK